MPAYLIVRIDAEDPERLKEYQSATPPSSEKYHGRFIARGGQVVTLEGPNESRRVIMEFPSLADAQAFDHSPEYVEARKLRTDVAVAEFIAVEGIGQPMHYYGHVQ